ncbi:hypothetical protein EC478_17675 [Shigella dysenteriae]|nr:hypothetical protein [Shigella dysenteriae]EFW2375705.1 hypothetical protein [Shigella flexneri]EFV6089927.1 hypothetical protein [Shigella dysenteriae]EFV6131419.1 hypothetical protein [Shigella dysenteriae]EFV6439567.1 hypothetical protein [Shigella dysenteriae]
MRTTGRLYAYVHIAPPLHADVPQPVTNEPVTLFLPGGVRMCCQPSQLTDVFRVSVNTVLR